MNNSVQSVAMMTMLSYPWIFIGHARLPGHFLKVLLAFELDFPMVMHRLLSSLMDQYL